MATDMTMLRASGDPICESVEKAGAKKQTASNGCSHTQTGSSCSGPNPSSAVNRPVSSSGVGLEGYATAVGQVESSLSAGRLLRLLFVVSGCLVFFGFLVGC